MAVTFITNECWRSPSCHGPDPVAVRVGDHQAALCRHRDGDGVIELGAGGGPAVAGEPGWVAAGHGVDVPRGHRLAVERPGGSGHDPDAGILHIRETDV